MAVLSYAVSYNEDMWRPLSSFQRLVQKWTSAPLDILTLLSRVMGATTTRSVLMQELQWPIMEGLGQAQLEERRLSDCCIVICITLLELSGISELSSSMLIISILNPATGLPWCLPTPFETRVHDSGIYTCQAADVTLACLEVQGELDSEVGEGVSGGVAIAVGNLERGLTLYTGNEMHSLLQNNRTHSLDLSQEGNGYLIHRSSPSNSGVYLCFQEGWLRGGYLLRIDEHKRADRTKPKSR
ncbi:hypothetical protein J4Q44_G00055910 [Coregonus suidteri]|uniref:Uncharacterized protein n=1 Tax=Coregonus suidteri TaxID=861788 RepID=A0AAN8MAD2_9TELE